MNSKKCITKTDWKCKSHGSSLTQRWVSECTGQGSGSEPHFVQFWVRAIHHLLFQLRQHWNLNFIHPGLSTLSTQTWKQSLNNPHRANSFAVWGSSSMNMWLISWLVDFLYWILKAFIVQTCLEKGSAFRWCLCDRSTSLRALNTIVQWDRFPHLLQGFFCD